MLRYCIPDEELTGAIISKDEKYRYLLWRRWAGDIFDCHQSCAFIGLNPSKAGVVENDNTVRRCIGFAKSLGRDSFVMGNLWPYRTKSPKILKQNKPNQIEGAANLDWLKWICRNFNLVIAAWGNHGLWQKRGAEVVAALYPILAENGNDFQCLDLTQENEPRHPLYVRADTPLVALGSLSYLELKRDLG